MMSGRIKKTTLKSRLLMLIGIAAAGLLIAGISIPNLLRSRIAANEASAVGSIRTLNTALASYAGDNPGKGFPQKLSDLSPYVDSALASGHKSGYTFRYVPGVPDFDGSVKSFKVEAVPVAAKAGVRLFASNETGQIEYKKSLSGPAQPLDRGPAPPAQTKAASNAPRMIRKTSLSLLVAKPTEVGEKIRALAFRYGGFVNCVRSSDEGSGTSETSIEIRVPADRLEDARREVRALADRVKEEQDDARDVSAQHVDLQSQLRNARAEEAQYLDIMRRSGTIKDTLAVSERLADVRGRIERTQGQLDQLAQQTEMALLEVSLRTETIAQPVDVHWHPFAEVKAAFWSATDDLSTYANFMIAALFRLPVFALWAATITGFSLACFRLLRWIRNRFVSTPVTAV